jgi:hypothetical protein
MRRPAELFLCAFLSLLVIPPTAESQASVDDRLAGYAELVQKEGFSRVTAYQDGMLREGNDSRFSVDLQSGVEYRIIGYCDEDCEDLDLTLYDPFGDLIESDILMDAAPLLSFTASSNGRFEVEVSMVTCTLEPCGFGVGVFGQGHEGAVDEEWNLDELLDFGGVSEQLEALEAAWVEDGYGRAGSIVSGWLDEDEEEVHYLDLRSGTDYEIMGVCDTDCEDLDLSLYDSSGDLVDEDLLMDDFPMLEFIGPRDGEFRLEVGMVTCTVEPCEYGVLVLRHGGSGGGSGRVVSETTHRGDLESADSRRSDGEYFDRYVINVTAGQRITVDMRSDDFDTFLILVSPARDRLENDDYEGSIDHSRIQVVAQETGEWEILASSFSSGSTGEYEVSVTVREGGR